MKSIMYLLASLLIILGGVFGNTTTVTAQQEYEPPCSDTSCTTIWNDTTTIEYLPGFPNCPVTVHWIWRICNGEKEIIVNSFGWDYNSTNCQSLTNFAYPPPGGFPNGDEFALEQLLNECFRQVAINDFMNQYNNLPSGSKYILECPNGTVKYTSRVSTCQEFCIYYNPDPLLPFIPILNVPLACGQECCEWEMIICFNTTTNTLDKVETKRRLGTGPIYCESSLTCPNSIYVGASAVNPTGYYYTLVANTPCASFCE